MRERFGKFALALHPDKTRLLEFGRFAAVERERRGFGKPETFAFLGFTFICGKSRQGGFLIKRKSPSRPHEGEVEAGQGGAASTQAPVHRRARAMVGAGRHGVFQLFRRADQRSRDRRLPLLDHRPMASHAPAA